jgi:hypothetical protein
MRDIDGISANVVFIITSLLDKDIARGDINLFAIMGMIYCSQ